MSPIPIGILAASGGAIPLAGYYVKGNRASTSPVLENQFATNTITTLASISAPERAGGHSNSGTAGFSVGGQAFDNNPFYRDSRTAYLFATKTESYAGTTPVGNRTEIFGCANTGVAGYEGGGMNITPSVTRDVVKFNYSNYSATIMGSQLPSTTRGLTGFENSKTAGYLMGGMDTNGVYRTQGSKINFANDAFTTINSGSRAHQAQYANKGVAGYGANGYDTNFFNAFKYAFPSDTLSTITDYNDIAPWLPAYSWESGVAGYIAGGYNVTETTHRKFAFPTDTRSALSALPSGVGYGQSFTNNGLDY